MKVLIIEDEEKLAKLLKLGLKKEGHAADYVTDGETGQRRIELSHRDYDVVILDLMLPKKNGLNVCREIRTANISIPILVLTAKDGLEDKVALLDAGADDYLTKPFQFNEIVARLRALTRRPKKSLPTELKIADLVLVPSEKSVKRDGKEIKLTLTEFRLLEYLMRRSNQLVERENIVENLWDFNFDSFSNIVDVYISKLRSKIDGKGNRKLLKTVHGVGYMISDNN